MSNILIQSEGTCYEHFLYSLVAAILVHLSTASYPRSHTFRGVRPIWAGTIFIELTNWELTNWESTNRVSTNWEHTSVTLPNRMSFNVAEN